MLLRRNLLRYRLPVSNWYHSHPWHMLQNPHTSMKGVRVLKSPQGHLPNSPYL